jgi:hypothetical protein
MTSTATEVPLRSYRPRPRLTLPGHPRPAARFPTVDAHSHPGRWLNERVGREGEWLVPDVANFLDAMTHSGEDPPLMGRWAISGLDLPDEVLQQVYAGNALRLVPRLAPLSTQRNEES